MYLIITGLPDALSFLLSSLYDTQLLQYLCFTAMFISVSQVAITC